RAVAVPVHDEERADQIRGASPVVGADEEVELAVAVNVGLIEGGCDRPRAPAGGGRCPVGESAAAVAEQRADAADARVQVCEVEMPIAVEVGNLRSADGVRQVSLGSVAEENRAEGPYAIELAVFVDIRDR